MSTVLARRDFLKAVGAGVAGATCGCGYTPSGPADDTTTPDGGDRSAPTDRADTTAAFQDSDAAGAAGDCYPQAPVEDGGVGGSSYECDTAAPSDSDTMSSDDGETAQPSDSSDSTTATDNPESAFSPDGSDTVASDDGGDGSGSPDPITPLNVLLITVDDMGWDSVGANGCAVPEITPNIDRFASEGIRFEHAHVNISLCQPCRAVIATGRYSHRNGVEGFYHTTLAIPTVMQIMKDSGYRVGVMAKQDHSTPHEGFVWDVAVRATELGYGRSCDRFYARAKQFFEESKSSGKPFYLMANVVDPHRPFYGSGDPADDHLPSRVYTPDEIAVPGFLPDLPDIRQELAMYYSSVRRADDSVGAVLEALKESGLEERTLVVLLSDNGMSFPFAKANCYPHSTRTPWIVRWPGRIAPGQVDEAHFISTVDFLPTVLEAVGLPIPEGLDGTSFLPLLDGGQQEGRDRVFTQCHVYLSGRHDAMRCVQDTRYSYIFNPWSNGSTLFNVEGMNGLSFDAMKAAAATDRGIAARVRLLQYRVLEELYDLENDPDCLSNLIEDPDHQSALQAYRESLREWMSSTGDEALDCFDHRYDEGVCQAFIESV